MTPTDFIREYETSGRTGGVERTLELSDEKVVDWFSDGTAHAGKAAVESAGHGSTCACRFDIGLARAVSTLN